MSKRKAPEKLAVPESPADPHRLGRLHLRECAAARTRLVYYRDEWWRWINGRYVIVEATEVRSEITSTVKREFNRIALRQKKGKKGSRFALRVTSGLVHNVIQAIAAMVLVRGSADLPIWLGPTKGARNYLAMSNGLLDIEAAVTGNATLHPHTPHWFSPVILPYPFDPAADCAGFLRFVTEVLEGDEERINLLQEWFGYCLTKDTSLQRFLVLEGEGSNGKSVVLQVLTWMLGEANVSHVPLEVFGDRFQLTPTLGMLANIASEVSECDRIAEGPLKQFVAGERMLFDRKNLAQVHAYPTARLVIATNNRVPFSDPSSGLWRRMLVIPFRLTIAPDMQDRFLAVKLKAELSGIFNWAVEGLWRLRERGHLIEPRTSVEVVNEHRLESNPARAFLTEYCQSDPPGQVSCAEVFRAAKAFCEEGGHRGLSILVLGKEIRRLFPEVRRLKRTVGDHRSWVYEGLRLTQVPQAS